MRFSLASSSCYLSLFLQDGTECLDEDDNDQNQALEGILDIHAEARNRNNDEVDRRIGQCAEDDTEHIAFAARHADARKDNGRNGVHLIALSGRGRRHISDLAGLENRADTHHQTCQNEDRDLYPGHVDTGETRALFVGANRIDALPVLRLLGDDDQEDGDNQKDKEDNMESKE